MKFFAALALLSSGCTLLFGAPRADAPADLASPADLATRDGPARVTWIPEPSGTGAALYGVWGCSNRDVIAVGAGATIVRSTVPGAWTTESPAGGAATLFSVAGSDCAHVYAVGAQGTIYFSMASGSWAPDVSGFGVELRGVWIGGSGGAAVGNGGEQLQLIVNGSGGAGSWTRTNHVNTQTLLAVFGTGATFVAVGVGGTILRSTDSGANWTPMISPTNATLRAGSFSASGGEAFVVGDSGTLLHSKNGGVDWDVLPAPTSAGLRGVWSGGPAELYVVGGGATILRSTDGGDSWLPENAMTGVNLNGLWGDGAGDLYAVGDGGTILRRP